MFFKTRLPVIVLAASLVCFLVPDTLEARAVSWAKRFPINQYTSEDIEIMKHEMSQVLEHGEDGKTRKWSNPETGHGGEITPLTSTTQDGKKCRLTRFRNYAEVNDNVMEYFLCRQDDGIWAAELSPSP